MRAREIDRQHRVKKLEKLEKLSLSHRHDFKKKVVQIKGRNLLG